MKIKKELLDDFYYSPITGKLITLRFIPKEEYKYWFSKLPQIFETCSQNLKYERCDDFMGEEKILNI